LADELATIPTDPATTTAAATAIRAVPPLIMRRIHPLFV
jgi:hypothetical protein